MRTESLNAEGTVARQVKAKIEERIAALKVAEAAWEAGSAERCQALQAEIAQEIPLALKRLAPEYKGAVLLDVVLSATSGQYVHLEIDGTVTKQEIGCWLVTDKDECRKVFLSCTGKLVWRCSVPDDRGRDIQLRRKRYRDLMFHDGYPSEEGLLLQILAKIQRLGVESSDTQG